MDVAGAFVSLTFLAGGLLWLWGAKYLERDTAAVIAAAQSPPPPPLSSSSSSSSSSGAAVE